jgi:hypothetical protein
MKVHCVDERADDPFCDAERQKYKENQVNRWDISWTGRLCNGQRIDGKVECCSRKSYQSTQ